MLRGRSSAPRPRRVAVVVVALAVVALAVVAATAVVLTRSSPGYDEVVADTHPVAYWPNAGSASMPDGGTAKHYDGHSWTEHPDAPELSIERTGVLTWSAWIQPDTLHQPSATDGYVDFLGKCASYAPSCEWEGRFYSDDGPEDRPSRLSGYAFNPDAKLGSSADWQPAGGEVAAKDWLFVVVTYDLTRTPPPCDRRWPGTITIWVDGVQASFADHAPTGCMSQYRIRPVDGPSPVRIGSMADELSFTGAVGRVAVWDRRLTQVEIDHLFHTMTGREVVGSCADTCLRHAG